MTTRSRRGRPFAGRSALAAATLAACCGLLGVPTSASAQDAASGESLANTNASAAAPSPATDEGRAPGLTLAPRGKHGESKADRAAPPGSWTGLIAAGIVAGGAGLALYFLRPAGASAARRPPDEVLAVLGRTPLADRQTLHVVRFGGKLLLVNVAAGSSRTLAEIDDPDEVERLERLCRADDKRANASMKKPSRTRETVDA